MTKEHNVDLLWVDCFNYQSNTVIIAEFVFRRSWHSETNPAITETKNSEIIKKSEFFLPQRQAFVVFCFVWLG